MYYTISASTTTSVIVVLLTGLLVFVG